MRFTSKKGFHDLEAKQIPFGTYDVRVACGEAEVTKRMTVDHAHQLEVIALSGRQMIGDHVKPKLTIKLQTPAPNLDTWWIRLVGLYNGATYTGKFEPENSEATITDPDPGSYLVIVSSTNGYSCVGEVDFVEFTRVWTFHPGSHSFEFDRFAHLVEDEDKRNQKQGSWYEQMMAERNKLRRAIDDAISNK